MNFSVSNYLILFGLISFSVISLIFILFHEAMTFMVTKIVQNYLSWKTFYKDGLP